MDGSLIANRINFAALIMFHYLFPALTMGLSVMIVILKTLQNIRKDERYGVAARFWIRLFLVNFGAGVATGVPMEFQFGTNWARFARYSGGIVGQPLMLEGTVAFFLESVFLGILAFGEKRVSNKVHWLSSILVAAGTILSAYFICSADAFMQHPVGYRIAADHTLILTSLGAVLTNPYVLWEFLHTVMASMVTGAMIVMAVSAYYLLAHKHETFARQCMTVGVLAGVIFAALLVYPTGSKNGEQVVKYNPVKLAAMEGQFKNEEGAPLAIIGMPDTSHGRLIDAVEVPELLSYLAYGAFKAPVRGIDSFSARDLPPIEVTYYAYHIMITLGGAFFGIIALGVLLLWKGWIWRARWYQWIAMLAFPFPYIANEAGWVVACVGRQPWIIYGLMRTASATSTNVVTGEVIFTLIGYLGLYALLGSLFAFLVLRMIAEGPDDGEEGPTHALPTIEPEREAAV